MNTNRVISLEEASLSATANRQENYDTTSGHKNNSCNSNTQEGDNSYSNLHECSSGICSTTWKPIQNIA